MKFRSPTLIITTLLLCLSTTQPVRAERVFIERTKGEQGQGWLFGAKNRLGEMRCWVALPAHVAGWRKGFAEQSLQAFSFRTMEGKEGVTGRPMSVNETKKAQDLLGRDLDLAFAPVESGFRKGECLSRLGLSSFVYDVASRKKITVDAVSVSKSRFDLFQMSLQRGGLGKRDYIQIFKPVDSKNSATYFRGGLSGSVVTCDSY